MYFMYYQSVDAKGRDTESKQWRYSSKCYFCNFKDLNLLHQF